MWEPAGSYTTVQQFMSREADPSQCPPGDVQIAIDNEQKVGKTSGRKRLDSKVPVDICTSLSYIQPSEVTTLQNDEELKPEHWQERSQEKLD